MKLKKLITITLVGGFPLVALATALLNTDGFNTDASNTVPNGSKSLALGADNEVEDQSLAVGENNKAYDDPGISLGGKSLAVGIHNRAAGRSLAGGSYSLSFWGGLAYGDRNYAYYYSAALGGHNDAFRNSLAAGYGNDVDTESIALGSNNIMTRGTGGLPTFGKKNVFIGQNNMTMLRADAAGVERSMLIGKDNLSDVDDAIVLGIGNVGLTDTVVVGKYNDPADPDAADAAVVLSCGADGNEKNGLVVTNDGDVILPKVQGDIPMGIYGQ